MTESPASLSVTGGLAPASDESSLRQLRQLRQAKLRALVSGRWGAGAAGGEGAPGEAERDGAGPGEAGPEAGSGFPGGATLADAANRRAWVLIDDASPASLGPALAWASAQGVVHLDLLIDGPDAPARDCAAGVVARRARLFRTSVGVWGVSGRELEPAVPTPGGGSAQTGPSGLADLHGELDSVVDLLRAHGVEPIAEPDTLVGELLGLEVARVVDAPPPLGPQLQVGIGLHDRRARAEMRPGQPAGEALEEVVRVVRRYRRPGAPQHPANRLARERWLRSVLTARPDLIGARRLEPRGDLLARRDWRAPRAAAAVGEADDGSALVAVCSVGVDLDAVPTAADHRALAGGGRLVVAVPEGDDYPVTHRLAAALLEPAAVVTVTRDWPELLA